MLDRPSGKVVIGDFCSTGSGGTPSRSNKRYFSDAGIPWIKSGELKSKVVTTASEFISEEAIRESSAKIVPCGAILIAMYGATVGAVSRLGIDAATNQAVCYIIPDPDLCDAQYLSHYLASRKPELLNRRVGGGQPNISQAIVRSLEVPLPPLPEQRRIAAILDKADALRQKRRDAIAKLDRLLQSVFLEMFGDPVTNPKGWPVMAITDLVLGNRGIKAGPFGSALKKEFYTESGYRIYGQEQVIAGTLEVGDYYIDENRYQALKANAVSAGDLLVSLVGSYGKVLIVPDEFEPGIINPRLLKIVPDNRYIASLYLAHHIQSERVQTHLAESSHGGTMGILNASLVKQLRIPVPPLEMQYRYNARVERICETRKSAASSATKLDWLFGSLQQRAFTGQL